MFLHATFGNMKSCGDVDNTHTAAAPEAEIVDKNVFPLFRRGFAEVFFAVPVHETKVTIEVFSRHKVPSL